jgi:hypothetical protein
MASDVMAVDVMVVDVMVAADGTSPDVTTFGVPGVDGVRGGC